MRYEILWCDGNGAASRGTESDHHVHTHITANSEEEMWKLIWLLRAYRILKSASINNLPSIKEKMLDEYEEEEDIEEMLNSSYSEKDLDEINLNGIDGGEPWVISIKLDGKEIYDCGYDPITEEDSEDW